MTRQARVRALAKINLDLRVLGKRPDGFHELRTIFQTISLADIKVPVLVFGGATDGIAPVPAVKAVEPLLTGSPEVRFEIQIGGMDETKVRQAAAAVARYEVSG